MSARIAAATSGLAVSIVELTAALKKRATWVHQERCMGCMPNSANKAHVGTPAESPIVCRTCWFMTT
jgi:hypothetical protein